MTRQDAHAPLTLGERVADGAANAIGSWAFIVIQTLCVIAWIAWNVWPN